MLDTLRSVLRFRPVELDRVSRRLARAACVDDLRRIAERTTPSGVFDYIDGAAEDERTLAANSGDFARIGFRPRVLRDVGTVDPSTTVLGRTTALPLVLAPTGFTRIADPQGELAVARAAARAGLPYSLSTMGTRSIEEVAAASPGGRHWFQVYVWRDRGLLKEMIDRAAAAGYEALIITVDTARLGKRERDVRRGFTLPPKIGLDTMLQGALHPRWTWNFVRAEPVRFANVAGRGDVGDGGSAVNLAEYINTQFDPGLSWADVDWMRSVWNGPIVLKGIQTVADAEIAVRARGRGDRPVQPRRPPARRRAVADQPRRPRRRRGRRRDRGVLRRRRAPRQRHRQGRRARRHGVHDRAGLPVRPGRRR